MGKKEKKKRVKLTTNTAYCMEETRILTNIHILMDLKTRNSTPDTDRNLSLCPDSLYGSSTNAMIPVEVSYKPNKPCFHMAYFLQSRRHRCLCPKSRNFTDRAIQIHSRLPDPHELAGNLPGKFLRNYFSSFWDDETRRDTLEMPITIFMLRTSTTDRAGWFRGKTQDTPASNLRPITGFTDIHMPLHVFCRLARPPNRPQSSRS
jgi:hypothetical protein